MKPTPTAAPIAVDALIALARTAFPGTLQVFDGPPIDELDDDVLIVGHSDGESAAIEVESELHVDMGMRRSEQGDIVCVLSCWSGDTNMRTRRERVRELYEGLDNAIRMNPGLGGAVDGAWMGTDMRWVPRQSQDGASMSLGFSVHYRAEI